MVYKRKEVAMSENAEVCMEALTMPKARLVMDGVSRALMLAGSSERALMPPRSNKSVGPNMPRSGISLGQLAKPKEGGVK